MSLTPSLRKAACLLVCFLSTAGVSWLHAQCVLDVPNQVQLGNYDPGALLHQPVAWPLRLSAAVSCAARVQIEAPDATGGFVLAGPDPRGLRVVLAQDAAGLTPISPAPQDLVATQLLTGQQITWNLWVLRPPNQWIAPGLYRGVMRVSVLDAAGRLVLRRQIALSVQVNPTVALSWSRGQQGEGVRIERLDFGELTQGAVRTARLEVQANSVHTITVESAQRGRLVNSKFPESTLSYELRWNGRAMNLALQSLDVRVASPVKAFHDIEVHIGPVHRVLAGLYVDSLLVTISAQ
jgi:hypothetical protein